MENNKKHTDVLNELIAFRAELYKEAEKLKDEDFGLTDEEEIIAVEHLLKVVQEIK